jgi:glycosyltransferase involved in cell wall biosynthesis
MPPERIHYAPCGVSVPPVSVRSPEGHRLTVAYVGRLEEEHKRISDIPRILARLDDRHVPWSLVIAGDGPDEAALRRDLASSDADGTVVFLGRLSPNELQRTVYARVDAVLVKSRSESGPIVIWEALSAGVAVVSSRYFGSGLEGALQDDWNSLLYPIGDADAAAGQLARIWREPQVRDRLMENGRRLAVERYSIGESVAAWETAFRHVLSTKPLPAAGRDLTQASRLSRLDRYLGPRYGELVRRLLRRTCPPGDAGGEWPHAYGKTPIDSPAFWETARRLDTRRDNGADN